jgi:carbonic anhydrase/acetyltransferase-like protein (isoleucine patch superfamily)
VQRRDDFALRLSRLDCQRLLRANFLARDDSRSDRFRYFFLVPTIHPTAFVHEKAIILGDVTLGARVSVWPTAVIRGDSDRITIGDDSNVQDGAIVHVDHGVPTTIGRRVGIGHRAIVHGATIEDDCLIAMGAILLNGVYVGTGSIVGAGAMCPEGMRIPPNSLVLGIPGRVIRQTTDAERERIQLTVASYLELQERYRG